jgi:hypothetical protein
VPSRAQGPVLGPAVPAPQQGPKVPRRSGGSGQLDLAAGGLNAGTPYAVYQFNGPVTYTDEEQGRRRAKEFDRRAAGDGVRRR